MTDKHLTFGDFQALPRGEEALIYSPPPPPSDGLRWDWLKFKNPAAPAVKREAEEDWGR